METGARPSANSAGARRPPRARAWRVVIAVLLLVVAVGLAVGYVRSHSSPFPDAEPDIAIRAPVVVGVPFYIGMVGEPRPDVTVTKAHVITEGAAVATGVALCELEAGGPALGAAPGLLPEGCKATSRVEGRRLSAIGEASVFMTVVPLETGTIRVRGVRLSFKDGWRRGTQLVGPGAVLTASDSH